MPRRRRLERLGRDLQPDEHQDREHRRRRQARRTAGRSSRSSRPRRRTGPSPGCTPPGRPSSCRPDGRCTASSESRRPAAPPPPTPRPRSAGSSACRTRRRPPRRSRCSRCRRRSSPGRTAAPPAASPAPPRSTVAPPVPVERRERRQRRQPRPMAPRRLGPGGTKVVPSASPSSRHAEDEDHAEHDGRQRPGTLSGSARCATSVTRMTVSDHHADQRHRRRCPSAAAGRRSAPARSPPASRADPARGTQRRTALPSGAARHLEHADQHQHRQRRRARRRPSPGRDRRGRARSPSSSAGSSTRNATPNVLGVSRPSGMAVTSRLPRAPRQAEGHPRVHQVAQQHAQRRAGDHARQHELRA